MTVIATPLFVYVYVHRSSKTEYGFTSRLAMSNLTLFFVFVCLLSLSFCVLFFFVCFLNVYFFQCIKITIFLLFMFCHLTATIITLNYFCFRTFHCLFSACFYSLMGWITLFSLSTIKKLKKIYLPLCGLNLLCVILFCTKH